MYHENKIWIGKSGEEKVCIYPRMANRHGMIAGATGTGKTITLKVLAESFSDCGVPVFLADVKGDLAGMCRPGEESGSLQKRIDAMGLLEEGFDFHGYPNTFWDIYGEKGLPLRTTVSEMGPLLLGRILGLNNIQSDILTIVFKIADDEELLLIDTKDLRSMLQYVGENAKEYSLTYGNISKQSLGAIIRAVVALEAEGGELFFGEPALNIGDWLCTDCNGKGTIQILDCQRLIHNPTMYATFMLWMISELFETLPETGDRDKPKMVFFFDEAHLLFDSAPKALLEKIEQVVKLIRSKGVGIYSCGQRAKRACLHAHLATAAGVNTPQLCCVASLMPRQLAAGLLTLSHRIPEIFRTACWDSWAIRFSTLSMPIRRRSSRGRRRRHSPSGRIRSLTPLKC